MPEGPSIVILREEAAAFSGRSIAAAGGNSKAVDYARLVGQPVLALHSWGKHFLIELPELVLRIHFLLFGSYRINARKDAMPRLSLQFQGGGEFNFYACSVQHSRLDGRAAWTRCTTGAPTSCRTGGSRPWR
ncbi:DNA-formamidopyrimidine glycosylase family protein [Massilia sp. Root351]|uniref:DNA-formamidopyrimidine glycosylase family protein n=1 Tax=Massilia sp. Root351 TaxID=1736522 RepID=UPI000ACBF51B|nr:DNA-formamidopyrimidine glycosylase family protein [Massilia sp. Root351]